MKKYIGLTVLLLTAVFSSFSQERLVDRIVATVGNSTILQSDLEMQYAQALAEGNKPDEAMKCAILQQLLTQKLLAQQAVIDSIEVSESQVDDELNRRIRFMTQRAGGKENLESFLNRSLLQHKEEMRPGVAELLKAQRMQQTIVSKIDVTPQEVKKYFESLNADSLPYFDTEIEYAQLIVNPILTKEEKQIFKDKAEGYRQQILNGSDFGTIARLYSEDGSAPNGGDLGFATRESYVKEFSAQAFRLKEGEISPVFETQYGFHFLQVLNRRGEEVNVRHVLIKTKPTPTALQRTKAKIDSIYDKVTTKKMNFNTAASLYSDDNFTKYNGGVVTSEYDGSTLIPVTQLNDVTVFNAIDPLKAGETSKPVLVTDKRTGETSYVLYYLKSRIPPHKASLEEDFAKIKEAAKQNKTNIKLSEWFETRKNNTFIDVNPDFMTCQELEDWVSTGKVAKN
ncbi:peptidylprolyl isomerase [Sphingobacterium lumbrici]|uniref:peptidylprolyl isomerase n=1 Tax=Sphingobacterium lumbrici TaxID=2559600 RepID=UPI001128DDD3|nr:peptidylprolyl isomerase [Sphingobacterium lumbrici]